MCDTCKQWMQDYCAEVPGVPGKYSKDWVSGIPDSSVMGAISITEPEKEPRISIILKAKGVLRNAVLMCNHLSIDMARRTAAQLLLLCNDLESPQEISPSDE